ncbi:MAG: hypothetical protein IKK83_03930 [Clostridia bacterium]|nr:hypothetical protein [Clostridia bacterium]
MQDRIKEFVTRLIKSLKPCKDDEAALMKGLLEGFEAIAAEYTTYEYSFNLAMDVFVELAPSYFTKAIEQLLEARTATDEEFDDEGDDGLFCAYYAISLIYKKKGRVDGLCGLLDGKYSYLRCYPLQYEVYSRYYKRAGDFKQSLACDRRAINILASRGVVNQGVCVSFASTVCTMLSMRSFGVEEGDVELARRYIEDAIGFNPKYPKYHFLKAQLLFYSAALYGAPEELKAATEEATRIIESEAEVCLYDMYSGRSRFITEEQLKYEDFKDLMKAILDRKTLPRFTQREEELESEKAAMLRTGDHTECVSRMHTPPLPQHRTGDKYFFVCYCSRDYKSVYSDLFELYRHKVPFRYDERLTHGLAWREQVELYVMDADCVGVVFYISKSTLLSDAVCSEIDMVKKHGKKYCCVNLEGKTPPSRILVETVLENSELFLDNGEAARGRMVKFLEFFDDDMVYTHKMTGDEGDGTEHIPSFISDLTKKFPELVVGE